MRNLKENRNKYFVITQNLIVLTLDLKPIASQITIYERVMNEILK